MEDQQVNSQLLEYRKKRQQMEDPNPYKEEESKQREVNLITNIALKQEELASAFDEPFLQRVPVRKEYDFRKKSKNYQIYKEQINAEYEFEERSDSKI